MKDHIQHIFPAVFLLLFAISLQAQDLGPVQEDSLRAVLKTEIPDTTRVNILLGLARSYYFKQPDTCLLYAESALELARKVNYELGILRGLVQAGEAHRSFGYYIKALKMLREALELARRLDDAEVLASAIGFIGMNYFGIDDYDRAISNLRIAIDLRRTLKPSSHQPLFNLYLARAYIETERPDSAFYFLRETKRLGYLNPYVSPNYASSLGDIYTLINEPDSANYYYRLTLKMGRENPNFVASPHVSRSAARLSSGLEMKGQIDSALYFARYSYRIANQKNRNAQVLDASRLLSRLHRKAGNSDSALYYQEVVNAINASINSNEGTRELQLLLLEEQRQIQEIQRAKERFQNNIVLIGLVIITFVILIASILLFRSNRVKQKTNLVLHQTLNELKATQSQLIQSEKMASLGELTAGIAHEIQNPLNFVNNFSEVNDELIDDLKKEVVAGNNDSVLEIANTIKSNQEKINHHGKRADGIVKSMLQHSRLSSGQKELTDINELCDEYVRLTYHGYRAKEKSFNVKLNSNFDPSLPKVNVVRQDIGRVLLNLLNNAFYAVNEKAKARAGEYEPTVTVTTRLVNGNVEIRVSDNGNGVPEAIKEKIFQPFFTTKPTGQGTGLGLSLSYDIVKAHGGSLQVNSREGEGSEFVVHL